MNKYALVTGGTSGIGAEIARRLVLKGYSLILVYISNEEKAMSFKTELGKSYPDKDVILLKHDLSNEESRQDFFGKLKQILKNDTIEVFVSSHGRSHPKLFIQQKFNEIKNVLEEHLISNMQITHFLLNHFCHNDFGRVIFITSLSSHKINRGQLTYSLSKGAIEGFVQSLTAEFSSFNINFNCISSGFAETNLSKDIYSKMSDKDKKNIVSVREIADLAELLIKRETTSFRGSSIRIDSGQFCLNNNMEYHKISFHLKS